MLIRRVEPSDVEGWYVDPAMRGKGVGSLLIEQAEYWARDRGYSELASDAQINNHLSIAAHGKLGFEEVERSVAFIKRLR
jgi:aminoglycoside 6'-N-acetyltransferase I